MHTGRMQAGRQTSSQKYKPQELTFFSNGEKTWNAGPLAVCLSFLNVYSNTTAQNQSSTSIKNERREMIDKERINKCQSPDRQAFMQAKLDKYKDRK